MLTIIIAIAVFAIFFVFLSVRLIFLKNGEFKGTCSSQNPYLNQSPDEPCNFCGKTVGSCETEKSVDIVKNNA